MSELDFTTPEIADALLKLGFPYGGLIPDIHLYSPAPPSADFRISGPAYTVQMVRASDQTAPVLSTHFLDTAPSKAVVVIDAPTHTKNAVWDFTATAGAQVRQVAGVVISGRVRDLARHRAAGFPVFARGSSTIGESPFVRPSAINVPLVIQPQKNPDVPFPAVTIEPGDWIFADENAVVCVSKDLVGKVMEIVRSRREVEARVMVDIKAGKGVQASLKFHGYAKATQMAGVLKHISSQQ